MRDTESKTNVVVSDLLPASFALNRFAHKLQGVSKISRCLGKRVLEADDWMSIHIF
jgi:hypothetical protein